MALTPDNENSALENLKARNLR